MRASIVLRKVAPLLGFALLACASSGLSGNTFRQGDVAFRVGPMPDSWRLLEDGKKGDIASFALRDDARGITVGAAGRCHRDGDDVPLESLTQHLYIGFTHREFHSQDPLELDGRAALRTEMTARLDGVPKRLVFVVLKKDGCVYDFWRISDGTVNGTEFDDFVNGFQVVH